MTNPLRYRSFPERKKLARGLLPWAIGGGVIAVVGLGVIWFSETMTEGPVWLNGVALGMLLLGCLTCLYACALMLIDLTIGMRSYLIMIIVMILVGGIMMILGWS